MNMDIEFNIDLLAETETLINPRWKLAVNQEIYRQAYDFMPYRTGTLANEVDIQSDFIEHTAPYAFKMYENGSINFRTDYHAMATSYWYDAAMQARGNRIYDFAQNILGVV